MTSQTDFQLAELNKRTGNLGTWMFVVAHSSREEYSYDYHGKKCQTHKLLLTLQSPGEGEYCMAQLKAAEKNKQEVDKATGKFKEGTVWKMSGVSSASDQNAYVSSSRKIVVDLAKTSCQQVLQSSATFPPLAPQTMLAEIVQIASKQRFDVTGVVQTVSSSRHVQTSKGDRVVVDVCLLDDTNTAAADSKCKASLEFLIFFQATVGSQEPPDLVSFRDAASKGPLSFFGLEAEPQSTGIAVKTTKMFRWSPALGAKATALQKQFHSLQAVAASDTKCMSTHWEASAKVDYEALQVTQSNCFSLSLLKDVPDPGVLHQTVFQINFAQFTLPQPGSTILTNDKSRVFLATTLYDASGAVSVVVREKAALNLASVDSKEKFEELHAKGHLSFPLLARRRSFAGRIQTRKRKT